MKTAFKQQGLSSLGWLFFIASAGLFLTLILKLGTVYMDDATVSAAVNGLDTVSDIRNLPTNQIMEELDKKFHMNNIRDISVRDPNVLKITKENGHVTVDVNYQVTVNMFTDNGFLQTLDVIITFHHHKEFKG